MWEARKLKNVFAAPSKALIPRAYPLYYLIAVRFGDQVGELAFGDHLYFDLGEEALCRIQ